MAANPIFPLYYNDIDRSTRDWTDEEFGCYMRLLMHQWDKGEIPKESQRLTRIVTSLDKNWDFIRSKFAETPTGFVNERLEEIRESRLSFLKKQAENGKKGGRKPKLNPIDNPIKYPNDTLHNEYENENENGQDKGVTGEKEDPPKKPSKKQPVEITYAHDTPEFKSVFDDWVRYRKEKRQPLTATSMKRQSDFLGKYAADVAIQILEFSMKNGYQGLFEPKPQTYGSQNNQPGFNGNKLGTSAARVEALPNW